jgi:acyl-CoA synthetase (AMP-forming)/AMP-acid ligase II
MLLHDLLDAAVAAAPDTPAVAMADHRRDYAGLASASREVAGWLAARGVRRGDRVVIVAPVHPLHAPLVYGCSRIGAVFAILHEQVTGHGLTHVLEDARPALVIADDPASRALATGRGIPALSCVDAARECASAPPPPRGPDPLAVDPVCFIYTSGSTGMPKAVVSTHAQVVFAATAIQSQLGYRPGDVVYCPLPLSFDYGLYQLFLAALSGASVHLGGAADTGPVLLRSLRTSGATVLAAVPSLAASLAVLLDRFGGTVPLRLLTNTGAAMPGRTLDILRKHLPDLKVQLMFGLTECKRVAIMPPDEDLRRPGACGRPLPGTEVMVVDDDGRPVPAGTLGELVVRGPHVMAGYWRRPELNAQRFRLAEGLFPELHTGDYGWLDEDGYLYFSGRRDDIYKSRGFRVSATEVEAAALRVAGVRAAAVLPPGGDRPDAVLYAVTDLGKDELLDRLREQIEPYKVPARCVPLEAMPLNANGKTDKVALAAAG